MGLGFESIGVLVVIWLLANVLVVGVALAGAGVHARRAARLGLAHSRLRAPVATVRLGAGGRRGFHPRRRSHHARVR